MAIKELARRYGIDRNTVRRALRSDAPPRYERAPAGSKLDPFKDEIHRLLATDSTLTGVRVRKLIEPQVAWASVGSAGPRLEGCGCMSAAPSPAPSIDVTVADLERDPYPIYARLRREAPVCWVPAVGMWLVTRWDDVVAVATETDRFSARNDPVDRAFGQPNVLSCSGPIHKELRATLHPTMRPNAVDSYIDELVEPIARRALEHLLSRGGRADVMAEYFEPISVRSLASVLGMDDVDDATLRRWFAGMALGAANYEQDPDKQAQCEAVIAELEAYLHPMMTRLERDPDDSLISHMLWVGRDDGTPRPRHLVLPSLKVLILGGMQEPGHGAGSVLWLLLRHPEQLADVRADLDGLLPGAIEEGMRLIAPIHTQERIATEATELAGVTIPAGDAVAAVIASANRDESRFPNPDAFDPGRPRTRVGTFGFGTHFCSRACVRARAGADRSARPARGAAVARARSCRGDRVQRVRVPCATTSAGWVVSLSRSDTPT